MRDDTALALAVSSAPLKVCLHSIHHLVSIVAMNLETSKQLEDTGWKRTSSDALKMRGIEDYVRRMTIDFEPTDTFIESIKVDAWSKFGCQHFSCRKTYTTDGLIEMSFHASKDSSD